MRMRIDIDIDIDRLYLDTVKNISNIQYTNNNKINQSLILVYMFAVYMLTNALFEMR